ncbi:hypothetical protein BpHYR1_003343 [Brachionus plicatilis]|uniref:Uncharacterized protein n=1 Tax=Brachionus plicatilis TaxID=10195 RepID=A0A3M7R9G2_BRAPC|nr:hypothetical protein BpHYR1_003343 [Brachionus plicatilis]
MKIFTIKLVPCLLRPDFTINFQVSVIIFISLGLTFLRIFRAIFNKPISLISVFIKYMVPVTLLHHILNRHLKSNDHGNIKKNKFLLKLVYFDQINIIRHIN